VKLYVSRHTRTNYNDLGLCNSDPAIDVHLTELGLQQAEDLAKKLHGAEFERIIVSKLSRTTETAKIINKYLNVPIEQDNRLTDNATGFEGKSAAEYYAAVMAAPDPWAYKATDSYGGESLNEVMARVTAFLGDLSKRTENSILVVSHMSVIQIIVGLLEGLGKDEMLKVEVPHGEYRTFDI